MEPITPDLNMGGLAVRTPGGLLVPSTLAPVLITRTPLVDDDGSGEYGTVLNNDWLQTTIYDPIDQALAAVTVNVTGFRYFSLSDQDYGELVIPNLHPIETVVLYNHSIPITIHSLNTNGALRTGQIVRFIGNSGMPPVRFVNASTLQPNTTLRFSNIATSAPTPIAGGGSATYAWNGGLWLLLAHDQGTALTPTFSAADYTGNTGSWSVAAGNVAVCTYRLHGRALTVNLRIEGTTLSGNPGWLMRGIPGGFTQLGSAILHGPIRIMNSGSWGMGAVQTGNIFNFWSNMQMAPSWTNGACAINLQMVLEVN